MSPGGGRHLCIIILYVCDTNDLRDTCYFAAAIFYRRTHDKGKIMFYDIVQ